MFFSLQKLLQELKQTKDVLEKRYVIAVLIYFFLVLSFIFILQKHFPEIYHLLPVRLAIFLFILITVFFHYRLKNTYFLTNKKYLNKVERFLTHLLEKYPISCKEELFKLLDQFEEEEKLQVEDKLKKIFLINLKKSIQNKNLWRTSL